MVKEGTVTGIYDMSKGEKLVTKNGKPYRRITIMPDNESQTETFSVFDGDKGPWKQMFIENNMQVGDKGYKVKYETERKGEYTNLLACWKVDTNAVSNPNAVIPGAKKGNGEWRTPDQIMRTSAVESAIELQKVNPTTTAILDRAQVIFAYIKEGMPVLDDTPEPTVTGEVKEEVIEESGG